MKFTNQFSNATPCQSDVAADAWEKLCAYDEARRERINEIVGNCIENDSDWQVIMPDIFETDEIEGVVKDIIVNKSTTNDLFNKLIEIIDDVVEEDFEYYDRNISGDSLT